MGLDDTILIEGKQPRDHTGDCARRHRDLYDQRRIIFADSSTAI